MARYIDADLLLEQLSKKKPEVAKARYTEGFNDAIMRVRSMVSTSATADAIEVVRCRDCYYSEEMPGVLGVCLYCNHWCKNVDDGTFCSNGMKIKSEEGGK